MPIMLLLGSTHARRYYHSGGWLGRRIPQVPTHLVSDPWSDLARSISPERRRRTRQFLIFPVSTPNGLHTCQPAFTQALFLSASSPRPSVTESPGIVQKIDSKKLYNLGPCIILLVPLIFTASCTSIVFLCAVTIS